MSDRARQLAANAALVALLTLVCLCVVNIADQPVVSAQTGRESSLVSRARRIALEVSRARGLSLRQALCHRLASEAEMVELMRARVRSQYSPGELVREGQLLELLGLIESHESYEQRVYEMLGDGVAGLYDPAGDCLYLARWLPWEEQVDTLYHETVHALQDQHFDLERILRHRPHGSDRLAAASAIAEGDATAVTMLMAADGDMSEMASPDSVRELRSMLLRPAPGAANDGLGRYVRQTLAFSYADGLRRVQMAHALGGWSAVNALLSNPPASTEEVLHPERAAGGDRPVEVSLSRPVGLPASCRVVHQDTLGEHLLRTMLDRHLSRADASARVLGWGGDQAVVLDDCPRNGQRALILASVWDREASSPSAAAERFQEGLVLALQRRLGRRPSSTRRDSTMTFERGQGRCSVVSRRGRVVLYVEGLSCASFSQLSDSLFRMAHQSEQ